MIILIAAVDDVGCIARNGQVPWYIPGDLRRFRQLTMGHIVVMGSRTWYTLRKRPLDGRTNVVLSSTMEPAEGYIVARSVRQVLEMSAKGKDIYVIGGADVYWQFLPMADRIELTRLSYFCSRGDKFFPRLDTSAWWCCHRSEMHEFEQSGRSYYYQYVTYVRQREAMR